MKDPKNYYQTLGVGPDASEKDIKSAYRRLGFQHHPDRNNGSNESNELFKKINEAYDVLSDKEKKRQYDTFGINGTPNFRTSREDEEVMRVYKEKFFRENWDIFLSQIDDSTKILYAGFDPPVDIAQKGTHISKSRTLPILQADKGGSNVIVTSIGHNFYNYFLGIELREPVPATFMYPISGLFGRYGLSDHTDPENAPPIINFQKEYHNRTLIKRFGIECDKPLEAALVIRYLNEVSKLDYKRIFNAVLDATDFGKIDNIDPDAIELAELAAVVGIKRADGEEITYFDFDAGNLPEIINRMNVDWIDIHLGRSSLYIEMKDTPLPTLTVPYNDIFVPTTPEQQALGLAKFVPARSMESRFDDSYREERWQLSRQGIVADQYYRAKWGNMRWAINTPNSFDTALTAFLLMKVLEPAMSYFAPDRFMLKGPGQSNDSLENLIVG